MAVTNVGQPVAAIKAAASSGNFTAFSPNAGSSYVVCTALINTVQTAIPSSTVAWASGGSGTWQKLGNYSPDQFSPAAEVWWVHCTTAPGSSQISVTGNAQVTQVYATVSEITGDSLTQPGATVGANTSTPQLAITPNKTGSLCFQAGVDTFEGFSPATPNGSSTQLDDWNNPIGQGQWSTVTTNNTTAGVSVTVGDTNTVSANSNYIVVVEVVPTIPPSPQSIAHPGKTWLRRFKHPQIPLTTPPVTPAVTVFIPQASGWRPRPPFFRGRRGYSVTQLPIQVIPQATVIPQDSGWRPRPPFFRGRRGFSSNPPVVQVTFPPQSATPRRKPPFIRRAFSSSTPPLIVQVEFPPQQQTTRRRPPFPQSRGFSTSTAPLIVVQPTVPPSAPRRKAPPLRRRGFASAPPPAAVTVTVYPFQQPSPRRKPWLPPVRRGESNWPYVAGPAVTVYPFRQPSPRRKPFQLPVRRGQANWPYVSVVPFPQPSPRRKPWLPPVRRGKSVPPQPPSVTVTVYPFQQPSPRRKPWLPPVRRGQSNWPYVAVVPFPPESKRRRPWLPPVRRGKSVPPVQPIIVITYPFRQPSPRRKPWLMRVRRRLHTSPQPIVILIVGSGIGILTEFDAENLSVVNDQGLGGVTTNDAENLSAIDDQDIGGVTSNDQGIGGLT